MAVSVVLLVVALIVMVVLSPPLTLVAALVVPAMLVVGLRLRQTVYPASWDAQQRAGEVAGVVDEAVTGVRVVKGFGQEDRELRHLATNGEPRGKTAEEPFMAQSPEIALTIFDVPLDIANFEEPGNYKLEVRVTDQTNQNVLTEELELVIE